jgi:ATP-binding cassette subfamily C protein
MKAMETHVLGKVRYKRVHTPTVLQMEEAECGAACLCSILAFHGKWVSLEELRAACDVSRNGATERSIILAARNYGLAVSSERTDFFEVVCQEVPFIIFWNNTRFLIVEGFSNDEVFLNDPSIGPRTISYQEFQEGYSGVYLSFKPSSAFVQGGHGPRFIDDLWKNLFTIRKPMQFLLISGLLLAILNLARPSSLMFFVDFILGGEDLNPAWYFLILFFAISLITLFVNYLQMWMMNRVYLKLSVAYASRFFWHLLHLPLQFYMQRYGSEIANRLSLVDSASHIFTDSLKTHIINFLTVFIVGTTMFFFNPLIAALGVISVLGIVYLMKYLYRLRHDTYSQAQKQTMMFYTNLIEMLEGIETIQVIGLKYKILGKLSGSFTRMLNPEHRLVLTDIILSIVPGFLQGLVMITILVLGSLLVIDNQITLGMLLALQMLMGMFFSPILGMANLNQEIQTFHIDFNRLNEVFRNPIEKTTGDLEQFQEGAAYPLVKLKGNVDINNLQFTFSPSSPPVLRDIYLNISPGKCIALIGPTGSGKSTLAKVIAGLFPIEDNQIFFDGKPRSSYPHKVLTNSIGMVEQHPYLFRDTIWNNLTMMDATVPQEDVFWAARNACIHDDIISKKNEYSLVLETGGANLSGGQKQRLEIARVILRKPTILILDEATSSLDSKTESKIISNIRRLGCACIVITHRLSTINNCDEIVVMDKGRIIQKGTHDELKMIAGLYKDFIY